MNATTTSPAPSRDAKATACIAFWNASESVTRAKWLGRPSDNDSTSPARVTGIEYHRKNTKPVPRIRGVGYNLPAILADLYPTLGIGDVRVQLGIDARHAALATKHSESRGPADASCGSLADRERLRRARHGLGCKLRVIRKLGAIGGDHLRDLPAPRLDLV